MPIKGAYTPYELERARKAIDYVHDRYHENISAEHLSEEVSLDIKLLQRLMRFITGLTVHNYQIKVRVDRAKDDLSDFTHSVKFISCKHGFSSSSHFGREFKKQYGFTPTEYRYQLISSNNPGSCYSFH